MYPSSIIAHPPIDPAATLHDTYAGTCSGALAGYTLAYAPGAESRRRRLGDTFVCRKTASS